MRGFTRLRVDRDHRSETIYCRARGPTRVCSTRVPSVRDMRLRLICLKGDRFDSSNLPRVFFPACSIANDPRPRRGEQPFDLPARSPGE